MERGKKAERRVARASMAVAVLAVIVCAARGAHAGCGDYNADGAVGASDALGVLQTAVGSRVCAKVRCDVDGNGAVTGSDALVVLKNAVGGSIAWSCPAVEISRIDELPRATGPVEGGANLSALIAGASLEGGASSGINFASLGPDTFSADSSMAACEVGNVTKAVLNEAAQGDMILCYVQSIFAAVEDSGVDIYDGEFHTFALDFGDPPAEGEGEHDGGPSRVRLRLERDPDTGTITDFELFSCGDGVGEDVQTEYIRQTIDGPDFSMIATGIHDAGQGGRTVTVTGSLGDTGGFVGRKDVFVSFSRAHDQESGHGATELSQEADSFVLAGYDTGTFVSEEGSGTYSRQVHAEAELVDGNVPEEPYSISLLAMGHGAAKTRSGGTAPWGDWSFDSVEGWNGDTTQADEEAAAPFLGPVGGSELPEIGEAPEVVFEGETAWDCGGTPEMLLQVDMPTLEAACQDLRFGWDWVNCYDIIQPEPPPCEGEGCGPCEGPDCGPPPECWDETCTCNLEDPSCVDACWDPECGPAPCYGPDCGPPPGCWDEACTCDPEDQTCVDACWNPECGTPPCYGPDCGPPPECWDETCTCDPQDPSCVEACWNPECGDPCEGGGCEPCEGAECAPPDECWDDACTCDPQDPQCMEACWDPECGDPPCYGPDCGF